MTKSTCFDAVVEFSDSVKEDPVSVLLCVNEISVAASLRLIGSQTIGGKINTFVQAHPAQSLSLKWKQSFTMKYPNSGEIWGEGTVLDPFAEKFIRRHKERRIQYLQNLLGNEKKMLLAIVQFKGIHGVQEKEMIRFGHHSRARLLELSQELESEGRIRILEFSPLFIISQTGIVFLCDKILRLLGQFHEKHPGDMGIQKEKIQKRFKVHSRILTLALKYLTQDGKIKVLDDHVALSSFEMILLPEEEKILEQMEEMYLKDKFQSVSLDELQRSFRISSKRLNKMLTFLTERKKVVLGRDGFILHSRWLDELIQRIRSSGKRELTVTEFKEMTGLTRKYAIPLLELLDQMGITRRRGSSREIL
ncbi:MAG: SelB C-terminal domain-containing protein [Candidatus Aminicenantes bacterium]|nr:MAG: SelB C-terminal domain-containing protein [Candidatus Aminicenantes bacterium]